jgi:hypothetical protein
MGIMTHKNQFKNKTDHLQGRKLNAMGLSSQFIAEPNFLGQSYLNVKEEPSFIETFRHLDVSQGPSANL